ncbi:PREDICTED: ADP-ribosylation factor-binding protein GGA2 [Drosophila arizonae]|uniref:ADP-ribosylation factor-binding protein GGA2 n=1 Tax=Drosophila arizonae TaxID=7263 RepID=A0ABM1PRM1_DROAR|nr:PREDICTED: ADP-ribosylation factor-binding protein GGA2 [Drosophila arizonae]
MTTDESIMTEMLDRATNPTKDRVDELGVKMFCIVVGSNSQLVHKAQSMIVAKMHSSNIKEATRAIALLEECMTQCGDVFQEEAAKFRFLNELIRLVSKKYDGAETPLVVKQRIMECLLLWTTEFPQRQKIRDAYDMLRKEGEIDHGQTAAALAKRESVLSTIDEAMFAKLIKSKDPENFKRANLLVQYRIAQEARRNDLLAQHRLVLVEVQETMQLLNQMLDSYNPDDCDVNETIHELYRSCKKHKPIFQHLPELLGDTDTQLIEDTLETNEALVATMARFKQLVSSPVKSAAPATALANPPAATTATAGASKAAGAAATTAPGASNATLINELLGDLLLDGTEPVVSSAPIPTTTPKKTNVLEDLSEIFSSALAETANKQEQQQEPFQLAGNGELLSPQVLSSTKSDNNGNGAAGDAEADVKQAGALRKMPEIDMLSEKLFEQILPAQERMSSFKRDPEKLTLNDLARERIQVKPAEKPTPEAVDDVPLLSATPKPPQPKTQPKPQPPVEPQPTAAKEEVIVEAPPAAIKQVKHLSEISVELDNIQGIGEERVMLDDDDLQLCLNITDERPSSNVSVIVISAQNKSRQPVKDFQFEASVKKPCKVRLLPPTGNVMPGHKPFRPSPPINQVMLLLNPTGKPVDVTCIVGYRLGDDPDPIKESIVAQGIPYVE